MKPVVKETTDSRLERLYARTRAGIHPGLESIARVLNAMGHPERSFLAIHVAGTNGKGSTCAMIEAILREHGLRTGLYTSPHLERFHERIQVNGKMISDADLAVLLDRVDAADRHSAETSGDRECTFFELATAMAFQYFKDQNVQVAIVEVGMGGRWDATNTVRPIVSVITPIGMDHTEYLGPTLASIASEKAGILKPGIQAISADQTGEVRAILENEAERLGTPLRFAQEHAQVSNRKILKQGQSFELETDWGDYGRLKIVLDGAHQISNATLAVLAVEAFWDALGRDLDLEALRRGLLSACWPGRCQVFGTHPPILVDGAHNPAGAATLAALLEERFPRQKGIFVLTVLADKDMAGILKTLRSHIQFVYAVLLTNERARDEEMLASCLASAGIEARILPLEEALREAREQAIREATYVCLTGSLYLIGAAWPLLQGEGAS